MMCSNHVSIGCVCVSVKYVMKAMINPYDAFDDSVAMEDTQIKELFRSEYDLPCRPHPNIVRVLHHFCASVPPRGQYLSACLLYYTVSFCNHKWLFRSPRMASAWWSQFPVSGNEGI